MLPLPRRPATFLLAFTFLLGACADKKTAPTPGMFAGLERWLTPTAPTEPPAALSAPIAASPTVEPPRRIETIPARQRLGGSGARGGAPAVQTPSGEIALSFENAEIKDVVAIVLGDTLGFPYSVAPDVQGRISVSSTVTRGRVVQLLGGLIAQQGGALVWSDGAFQVVPRARARSVGGAVVGQAEPGGATVRVIPLRYVSADGLMQTLAGFADGGAVLGVDSARNAVIVEGSPEAVERLARTVDIFDVEWLAATSFVMVEARHSKPADLVRDLEATFRTAQGQSGTSLRFVPIDRLGAVIAVAQSPDQLREARAWIERLDQPASGEPRPYVYRVRHGRAEDMARLLRDLLDQRREGGTAEAGAIAPRFQSAELQSSTSTNPQSSDTAATQSARPSQSQTSAAAAIPTTTQGTETSGANASVLTETPAQRSAPVVAYGGRVRIVADRAANTLAILATPFDYDRLLPTLEKLDVQPRQVMIEAMVAEVTLSDELRYGVEWFLRNRLGDGYRGTAALDLGPLGIAAQQTGFSYILRNSTGEVRAVIDALAGASRLSVLATPNLMVNNLERALIQVGDQVPVITRSETVVVDQSSDRVINSVEYRNTGIILEVIPSIGADDQLTLQFRQEVSQVAPNKVSSVDSPIFSRRLLTSSVTIRSGQPLFVGGLIRDDGTTQRSGIPLLQDIPMLGNAFRTNNTTSSRTELVVMLVPTILDRPDDARALQNDLRSRLRLLRDVPLPPSPTP
jgi:general secretion pathway protein D